MAQNSSWGNERLYSCLQRAFFTHGRICTPSFEAVQYGFFHSQSSKFPVYGEKRREHIFVWVHLKPGIKISFPLKRLSLHSLKSSSLQFSFRARSMVLKLTKRHWFVSQPAWVQVVKCVYKLHCFALTLFLPVYWSLSVSYSTQLRCWNFNTMPWI